MPFEFHLPTLEEMRNPRNGGLQMMRMIDGDNFKSALLTGVAGSGKTTVSIYRLLRLVNQRKPVRFLTYQRLLALAIKNIPQIPNAAQKITTFHKWHYLRTRRFFEVNGHPPTREQLEQNILQALQLHGNATETELIVDEGQDLPEVVYEVLPGFFIRTLVGADNGQKVHEQGADAEKIASILSRMYGPFEEQELGQNFRNTYQIYRFARQFLPKTNLNAWNENILDRLKRNNRQGEVPTVISYVQEQDRNEDIKRILQSAVDRGSTVAILCATQKEVDKIYNAISQQYATTRLHNGIRSEPATLENIIVTTYKSAKGLEFDEAILVRVNDNIATQNMRNQLFVACTRAKSRLWIYRDSTSRNTDPITNLHFEPDTFTVRNLDNIPAHDGAPF